MHWLPLNAQWNVLHCSHYTKELLSSGSMELTVSLGFSLRQLCTSVAFMFCFSNTDHLML